MQRESYLERLESDVGLESCTCGLAAFSRNGVRIYPGKEQPEDSHGERLGPAPCLGARRQSVPRRGARSEQTREA